MPEIKDYQVYLEQMKNGSQDKLFFADKIFQSWQTLVDIGCADGFITAQIKNLFPNKNIIGVDNDPKMLNLANANYQSLGITFTNQVPNNTDIYYMSSFLHELYSYQNANEISQFWDNIFTSNFKYIIIRDMIYDDILNHRELKINDRKALKNLIRNKPNLATKLTQYESIWGSIYSYKSFLHFLLKYQYDDNWEREIRENYLPLSFNQLMEILPSCVRITYLDHRTLPYFTHKWEQDLGIRIDEKVHCKIILQKH